MSGRKHKNGVMTNMPAPYSVKLHNAVEAKPHNYVVAQLRVDVFQDGGPLYSLQTGPIEPNETKAVFFTLDNSLTFEVVIETNHVTTWTSKKWDVLHTQIADEKSSRNFVAHGTPDNILLHALSDI